MDTKATRPTTRKEYVVDGMTYVVRFMGTVRTGWVLTDKDRWELLLKLGPHNGAEQAASQDFPTFTHIDVVAGRFGVGPELTQCECGELVEERYWDLHSCYAREGADHEAEMLE